MKTNLYYISIIPLILSLVFFYNYIYAQDKIDVIESLNFNYKEGYYLKYESKLTKFDDFNFPKKINIKNSEYAFFDNKEGELKIILTEKSKKDTVNYTTYLKINDKGMFWWINDELSKQNDKHKTHAISLPLFKGKTWNTHLNDIKVNVQCITLDTVINTSIGEFNTYGVQYSMIHKNKKTHTVYQKSSEYYQNSIGKIYYTNTVFVKNKKTDQVYRLSEDISKITSYGFVK